jgi:pimeloyl-ACP methyl ester carboxylesterase
MTIAPLTIEGRDETRFRIATTRLATGPLVRYVEQGDPTDEPIVFLHGYTDSWYSFSRLLEQLAPGQHHAYAFDQRGHGCSERPHDGYTVDHLAADVDAFLDAIGAGSATLVGHSMGSLVARRVAEKYPERVANLVLIGAALTVNEGAAELQAAVETLDDPVPDDFVREFQASTIHASVPESFFEGVVAESLRLPARVWKSVLRGILAADDRADLGSIIAPTLILWGAQDAYFPRADQEQLAAAIPGAKLLVYPHTGHSPHWERPEWVAEDLSAFLGD